MNYNQKQLFALVKIRLKTSMEGNWEIEEAENLLLHFMAILSSHTNGNINDIAVKVLEQIVFIGMEMEKLDRKEEEKKEIHFVSSDKFSLRRVGDNALLGIGSMVTVKIQDYQFKSYKEITLRLE